MAKAKLAYYAADAIGYGLWLLIAAGALAFWYLADAVLP